MGLNYFVRRTIEFLFIALIFFVSACQPTKYVPDNKYLLSKVEVDKKSDKIKKQELKPYLKQTPNKRVFWVKFHLWVYNLSKPEKDNWLNRWLRNVGEAPIIYDPYLTHRTQKQLEQFYFNRGYYLAEVTDTTIFRKRGKAEVIYEINAREAYTLRKKFYQIEDTGLIPYIYADTVNSILKSGTQYSLDNLEKERVRIETYLQNNGFYNFKKEFVYFELDSALNQHAVDVTIGIKENIISGPSGQPITAPHYRYYVDNLQVYPELNTESELTDSIRVISFDTTYNENIEFIYTGQNSIKSNVLVNANRIPVDSVYEVRNVKDTYRNISSLRMFRFVNIDFEEGNEPDSTGLIPLNGEIKLVPLKRQAYSLAGEFTNSGGNFGLGGSFIYQHRNTFKGAELLNVGFDLANEWVEDPTLSEGGNKKRYRSYIDFGTEASLVIPKFLVPFPLRWFQIRNNPKTSFTVSYKFQDRPYYTGTIANAKFGYNWQTGRYLTHIVNPIDINSVNADPSEEFLRRNSFNPYLLNSYRSHFVAVTNYSFVYNNQILNRKNLTYTFLRLNIETAGNILTWINNSTGASRNSNGRYDIFGLDSIEYAQYAKIDVDLRQSFQTTEENNLVYRFFAGVGYPYKNSVSLPFERQYFAGGANSIRAWRVWSLGPGSFPGNDSLFYHTADIKLESNLEYRFKMFWILEGALFLDIGNIWSIVDESIDNRRGAQFKFDKFYRDLAVGTGFGARFDLSFVLFRLDLGMKLRDPALQDDNKWIFNNPDFRSDIFSVQIGIGYPF